MSGRRYQRVSLVAGQIGNKAKNLIAPFIYTSTMVSNLFESWFKEMLLPCLDEHSKQTGNPCIIILDNARFHRMDYLQELANNAKYKHMKCDESGSIDIVNEIGTLNTVNPCAQ